MFLYPVLFQCFWVECEQCWQRCQCCHSQHWYNAGCSSNTLRHISVFGRLVICLVSTVLVSLLKQRLLLDMHHYLCYRSVPLIYTVIHNYGNPYEKWNIFVARPHLWLQLGMVKPEIMLCETLLNLSTLNALTYSRTACTYPDRYD